MISRDELMSGFDFDSLPSNQQYNIGVLLDRVNKIRTLWNKPMIVTSGYRSMEHHLAIYAAKGITDQSKIPMKSKHLIGAAVDISDPDGSLKKFVKNNNYKVLEDAMLWMEDESTTHGWLHVQIFAPMSSKREFMP